MNSVKPQRQAEEPVPEYVPKNLSAAETMVLTAKILAIAGVLIALLWYFTRTQ